MQVRIPVARGIGRWSRRSARRGEAAALLRRSRVLHLARRSRPIGLIDALWGGSAPPDRSEGPPEPLVAARRALGSSAIETVPACRLPLAEDLTSTPRFERLAAEASRSTKIPDRAAEVLHERRSALARCRSRGFVYEDSAQNVIARLDELDGAIEDPIDADPGDGSTQELVSASRAPRCGTSLRGPFGANCARSLPQPVGERGPRLLPRRSGGSARGARSSRERRSESSSRRPGPGPLSSRRASCLRPRSGARAARRRHRRSPRSARRSGGSCPVATGGGETPPRS